MMNTDDLAIAYYLERRNLARARAAAEEQRVLDVIARGAEDDEPPPDENLLDPNFMRAL
jgi:hypothetical protein